MSGPSVMVCDSRKCCNIGKFPIFVMNIAQLSLVVI